MKPAAGVGLGYVGLPLAVEVGNSFPTIGFDLNAEKVAHDRNRTDPADAREEYDIELVPWERPPVAETVVVAVADEEFLRREVSDCSRKLVPNGCFVGVKAKFDPATLRSAGFIVWRL